MTRVGAAGFVSTHWNDYVGTVAADDAPALPGVPSLYELSDLDRSRWTIVGVDFSVSDWVPVLTVLAADRPADLTDLAQLLDPDGQLPVNAFRITEVARIEAFLRLGFQQLSLSLRPRSLEYPIRVTHHGSVRDAS